jgi:hypothetical protein
MPWRSDIQKSRVYKTSGETGLRKMERRMANRKRRMERNMVRQESQRERVRTI